MRLILITALLVACFSGWAGLDTSARQKSQRQSFGTDMSLEETLAYLSKELKRVRTFDTAPGQRERIDNVRADGCTIWFRRTFVQPALMHGNPGDALSEYSSHRRREVWAVKLAALDPSKVKAGRLSDGTGQVWFFGSERKAAEVWPVYGERLGQPSHNVGGYLRAKDERAAGDIAAAMKHAAGLCRRGSN